MSAHNTSGAGQGLPAQNTFPAFGANDIDTPSSTPPAQQFPQPSSASAGVAQAGSQGPPNGPPGNPPVAAAPGPPDGGDPGPPPPGAPPAGYPPPPPPPPNNPPAGFPPPGGGAPAPYPAIPVPVMNMAQPFVMPCQQPFLWVNPPVVSSQPAAYPGYRSSQQSPYWTNTSYWLTNPPQQQQQPQQYVYPTGYPMAYPWAPGYPTYYYM